ncbi:hypothetical protein [Micromonospora sp. WMMD975]|uniref:hypothetical protein n=1 Tax=Micromonospora sp. WMMD975 TaxID=3016087 RepID=UPI00249CC9E8|nr:hypothetical protein [Micromonospora sp. WMMD975]WFE32968.1 hypothetical protein O7613_26030 [Micromonospora sp. WMMD975]
MSRMAKWIITLTIGAVVAASVFVLIAQLASANSARWPLALGGATAVVALSASIAGSWASASPVVPTLSIGHTVNRSTVTGRGSGTTAAIIGGDVAPSGTVDKAPETPTELP